MKKKRIRAAGATLGALGILGMLGTLGSWEREVLSGGSAICQGAAMLALVALGLLLIAKGRW